MGVNKKYIALAVFVVLFVFVFHFAESQSTAIIELYAEEDGSIRGVWVNTLTPYVITTTPGPTQTPWVVTATPDSFLTPTPTQEVLPTATPTPELCYATALVNLSYRQEPSVSAPRLGIWEVGTRLLVTDYVFVGDNEWALVQNLGNMGWSAAYYAGAEYLDLDNTQACLEIKFPEPEVALLWHAVPNFNIDNARISYEILKSKKTDYGIKIYADMEACIDALDREGECEYRHANVDCPQNIGTADARQSARNYLEQYGTYACTMLAGYEKAYYEPVNECLYGSAIETRYLYWWAEWLDEYIDAARELGCPKLILPTLGPGGGDEEMFRIWSDVLNKLAENGSLFGEHAYTPGIEGGLCGCDEWLACRHRKTEQWRQAAGVNIDVAITEAARGWGNDPVDEEDFVCWYETIRNDDWVHSVSFWTAGYHPTWPLANLDNHMISIAEKIAP